MKEKTKIFAKSLFWRVIRILIIGVLCSLTVIWIKYSSQTKEMSRIDISEFSGRVLPCGQVSYNGPMTVYVSFEEALKFKEDAILSYSGERIEIWKPDPATKGAFLHSDVAIKEPLKQLHIVPEGKYLIIYASAGALIFFSWVIAVVGLVVWFVIEVINWVSP